MMLDINLLTHRLSFCDMTSEVSATLKENKKRILAHMPAILDAYFARASENELAMAYYRDADTMNALKKQIVDHWHRTLDGHFDETYYEAIAEIGLAHYRLGPPRWFFNTYQHLLANLIAKLAVEMPKSVLSNKSIDRFGQLTSALSKLCFMEVDIAAAAYRAAAEKARDAFIQKTTDRLTMVSDTVIANVASIASNLQQAVHTMAEAADVTAVRVENATHSSRAATANVNAVAGATEELAKSVHEISQKIGDSATITNNAVKIAGNTAANVNQLSEEAQRIGDILKLITGIADQTNLLALNATIEAARAGDAGKGFAVVAQEVKSLASQTAKATAQISEQISNIQNSTTESVTAITQITEVIGRMDEISGSITTAVTQQDAATKEISRNIDEASSSAHAMTSDMTEVTATAQSTLQTASEVRTLSNDLVVQADKLRAEMIEFVESARKAS